MSAQNDSKRIGCYLMFLLMMLSASFKIFHYGPSVHFYVYPLTDLMLTSISYFELLGGVLYLRGAKKMSFRVYGGLLLIPLLSGAVASHIAFGWLNIMNGISEPFYFTLPSFIILCLSIWISYEDIKKFIKSKLNKVA